MRLAITMLLCLLAVEALAAKHTSTASVIIVRLEKAKPVCTKTECVVNYE